MKRIAKFDKISADRYVQDMTDAMGATCIRWDLAYDNLIMPKRATKGSAGYDFHSPMDFMLGVGESMKIPTGMRCKMKEGWVLKVYPRSGLGFKYRVQLDNSVGIIEQDYFYSDNEGHIILKITNDGKNGKIVNIKQGEAFAQGIFSEYGITEDDCVTEERNGGFGSTTQK